MKLMLVQECVETITTRATTSSRRAAAFTTFLSLQVWLDSITEEFEGIVSRFQYKKRHFCFTSGPNRVRKTTMGGTWRLFFFFLLHKNRGEQ